MRRRDNDDDEEEEEEEEEKGLFKADAVNEEDPERDRATQEEEEEDKEAAHPVPSAVWVCATCTLHNEALHLACIASAPWLARRFARFQLSEPRRSQTQRTIW